jgi:hypothetical protein
MFIGTAGIKPEPIPPTILQKADTILYIEYIPRAGNLFTTAVSWYNIEYTYYFQDKNNGVNVWSMTPEYRPHFKITYTYDYYGSDLVVTTDTIIFDTIKY